MILFRTSRIIYLAVFLTVVFAPAARCATDPEAVRAEGSESARNDRPWFVFLQLVNPYPHMKSEEPIHSLYNPAMRLLAPGFNDVRTVGDLRDEHKLWVPQFGAGKVLSDHWVVYFQGGWTKGKIRTKATDRSIFLLPMRTDFLIERGATSTTFGANYYPFGVVELRHYESLRDRLHAVKPMVGTDMTWTYATFRAQIKLGFSPFRDVLNLELSDAWYVPSIGAHAGLEIPMNEKNSIVFGGGYSFFLKQEEDFQGASFTINWNRYFR